MYNRLRYQDMTAAITFNSYNSKVNFKIDSI